MSDIGLRLDGLILGMVMAGGALLFAVIAAVLALRTLLTLPGPRRSWKIAARSIGLALINAAGLMILAIYLDEYGAPAEGPDWLDWLSVPWLGFILVGLVTLVRSRARPATPAA